MWYGRAGEGRGGGGVIIVVHGRGLSDYAPSHPLDHA